MQPETVVTLNINAFGCAAIIAALLAIVWKAKQEIIDTVRAELRPMEGQMRSLREEIRTLQKQFTKAVLAITEIQTILRAKFDGLTITHGLVEKGNSPLNPTGYGASLIKDSGLEKILDDNTEVLLAKLKASLPQAYTDYDVQERARKLLLGLQDDPMMAPVKNWVYEHPMDITTILRVGGLWLRNDFLQRPRETDTSP